MISIYILVAQQWVPSTRISMQVATNPPETTLKIIVTSTRLVINVISTPHSCHLVAVYITTITMKDRVDKIKIFSENI